MRENDTDVYIYNIYIIYVLYIYIIYIYTFFFGLFAFSTAVHAAYGGSQARDRIRAAAAGLRQSHSNAGSKQHLRPTPQLTATRDP